jgi:hypothetical protein
MAFYFRNCNPLPRTVLYLEHFPTINNSWDTGTVQFSIGFLILCIDVVVANSIKFESVNYCQIHYNYPGGIIASCIVTYFNIPPVTMMMVFIYLFIPLLLCCCTRYLVRYRSGERSIIILLYV